METALINNLCEQPIGRELFVGQALSQFQHLVEITQYQFPSLCERTPTIAKRGRHHTMIKSSLAITLSGW